MISGDREAERRRGGAMAAWHRFARESRGGVVIIFAITLPVLLGALGLGIELGMWYLEKRRIQEAADSGAMQGAFAYRANPDIVTDPDLKNVVNTAVARSGYNNANTVDIAVERPPLRGRFTSDTTAVEVTIDVAHQTYFIAWFGFSDIPIQARAVAMQGAAPSEACVLALGNYCTPTTPDNQSPIMISGNATLNLEDCGIHANGECPTGINGQGSSILGATCVSANTQLEFDNYCGTATDPDTGEPVPLEDCGPGGDVYSDCQPKQNAGIIEDPFAHLVPPAAPACSNNIPNKGPIAVPDDDGNLVAYDNQMFPGCYDINGPVNDDVYLHPGVYWFDGGIKFHGKIKGDGVVLIIMGDDGDVDINANEGVDLRAPTHDEIEANLPNPLNLDDPLTGQYEAINDNDNEDNPDGSTGNGIEDWATMLIYNATAGTNSCSTINGTVENQFEGAIYMPEACVTFNGDADTNPDADACLMLIADQMTISGHAGFGTAGCGAESNLFQTARAVGLVE